MRVPRPRRIRRTIRLHPLHLAAIIAVTAIGTGGLHSVASSTGASWQIGVIAGGMIAANFLRIANLTKRVRGVEALLRRSLLLQSSALDEVHSRTITQPQTNHRPVTRRRSVSESDDPSGGHPLPHVPPRR